MSKPKRGLGKGLNALFDESAIEVEGGNLRTVALSAIEPTADQPRRDFDEDKLQALADSIAAHGVLQPLLVTDLGNGRYQLVAGERRWRAARMAGLTELPVQIRELTEQQILEVALVENLQREDLNPIEQAEGYRRLADSFSLTQEEIAQRVGRSRSAVANTLRLLALPETVRDMVREGMLSEGHGRAVAALPDEVALTLAQRAAEQQLSVRQLERLAAQEAERLKGEPPKVAEADPRALYRKQLGEALSGRLGRRVSLHQGGKKGRLEIEFYDNDDLSALLSALGLETEL
ncbi:MAG: ParB/RepB/Spo0J family partition protein [Clostridia bacterium]|nr:ParB/RepB/Spo0J family partition protein [Clostridia bacterium]MBQ3077195.1 ParB/RepB/Spo0J family partition protein [Clostridia bacterium]